MQSWRKCLLAIVFDAIALTASEESAGHCHSQSASLLQTAFRQRGPPVLFVAVISAPTNTERREEIRSSWFKHELFQSGNDVRATARFIIGQTGDASINAAVQTEEKTYDDILRVSVLEGVGALTNKTLATLQWFAEAPPASYLLKIDDDSFPELSLLVKQLEIQVSRYVYAGIMVENCPPLRQNGNPDPRAFQAGILHGDIPNKTSPLELQSASLGPYEDCGRTCGHWSEGGDFYPNSLYPRYALGSSYVLSSDLVRIVAEHAQVGSRRCQSCNEDVSIGIWLSQVSTGQDLVKYLPMSGTTHGCTPGLILSQNLELGKQKCMWERFVEGSADICCPYEVEWENWGSNPLGTSDCAQYTWQWINGSFIPFEDA